MKWNNLLIAKLIEFADIRSQINIVKVYKSKPIIDIVRNNILDFAIELKQSDFTDYINHTNVTIKELMQLFRKYEDIDIIKWEDLFRIFVAERLTKEHLYVGNTINSTILVKYKIDLSPFRDQVGANLWYDLIQYSTGILVCIPNNNITIVTENNDIARKLYRKKKCFIK